MNNYKKGIFDHVPIKCVLDHATLLVGYGVVGDAEFWIMKNSFSEDWGEKGYMRMLIQEGVGTACIQKMAS